MRTSTLRYQDLEVGDLLYDDKGILFRVTRREASVYSRAHDNVIVPTHKVVSLMNEYECSGAGQRSHQYFFGFDNADWIWHSRFGCLIP